MKKGTFLAYAFGFITGLTPFGGNAQASAPDQDTAKKPVDLSMQFRRDLGGALLRDSSQRIEIENVVNYADSANVTDANLKNTVILTMRIGDNEQLVSVSTDNNHDREVSEDEVILLNDFAADKKKVTQTQSMKTENGRYSVATLHADIIDRNNNFSIKEYPNLQDWQLAPHSLHYDDDLLDSFQKPWPAKNKL